MPPSVSDRRVSTLWLIPLVLLPVPLLLNDYQQFMLNLILVYVPVGIGFNIVIGNLGLLAFSNVAYFGLGAYTSGILMAQFALPWFVTLLPVVVLGACTGCIAAFPALRGVRLFYLAIMTLAFGELMRWLYIRWESVTGGSMGMVVPPSAFPLDSDRHRFYIFLIIAVLSIIATCRLLRSRFGRAFEAIRGNEIAAAAMGIHTDRLILLGFAWDGALTAIAGAMLAISIGHITPDSFDLNQLIVQFAIVMVGGLGSLTGSVIGALVITALPQFFISFPGFQELAFGVMIVLIILFLPHGLAGLIAKPVPALRQRFHHD